MPRTEFEPTTSVFERAKTVHALDRAATVIGPEVRCRIQKSLPLDPTLNQINTVHILLPIPLKLILILSPYLRVGLPSDLFSSGFLSKFSTHFSSLPCMLHTSQPSSKICLKPYTKQSIIQGDSKTYCEILGRR
jgi:hypothetical protein